MTDQELADAIRERLGNEATETISIEALCALLKANPYWKPKPGDGVHCPALGLESFWFVGVNPRRTDRAVIVDTFGLVREPELSELRPWRGEA